MEALTLKVAFAEPLDTAVLSVLALHIGEVITIELLDQVASEVIDRLIAGLSVN